MLSRYAKSEWLAILVIGLLFAACAALVGVMAQSMWPWWGAALILALTIATLSFFRDPDRPMPTQRNVAVAPADGKITSIHELEHFEPFDEPATCVRIFLSVFNVHVNRCPLHGKVQSITYTPGKHGNALNPESPEDNENNLITLVHPIRGHPAAAVRQIAGMVARTIACGVEEGQTLQRSQRIGMIKLGSTVELYLPQSMSPRVQVVRGAKVKGGVTVLAHVSPPQNQADTTTPAGAIAASTKPGGSTAKTPSSASVTQ
jgi:phosphatidylserine decarboxylase